jgi:hypothetical protein
MADFSTTTISTGTAGAWSAVSDEHAAIAANATSAAVINAVFVLEKKLLPMDVLKIVLSESVDLPAPRETVAGRRRAHSGRR